MTHIHSLTVWSSKVHNGPAEQAPLYRMKILALTDPRAHPPPLSHGPLLAYLKPAEKHFQISVSASVTTFPSHWSGPLPVSLLDGNL